MVDDELEARVAALEEAVAALTAAPACEGTPASELWVIERLGRDHPEGAVVFGGALTVPEAGPVRWQMGLTADQLSAHDWAQVAPDLAALGHPVRLQLLQLVFNGVHSTGELTAQAELGTSGQLHHHLRSLVSSGWLISTGRGQYQLTPARVVPLLIILLAGKKI